MNERISRRTLLSSVGVAGLSMLGVTSGQLFQQSEISADQWPQYGRDGGNTGANLDASGPSPDNGGDIVELWAVSPTTAIRGQPAITESNAVVTTTERVLGVNLGDGTVDWEYDDGQQFIGSPATVATDFISNEVYVGTDTGDVIGLSTATGEQIWQHGTANDQLVGVSPLTARGAVLYVAGSAGLSAVSTSDQTQLWTDSVNAATTPAAGANSVWTGNRLGMAGRSPAWAAHVLETFPISQSPAGDEYVTLDARGRWGEQKTPTVEDGAVYLPSRGVTSIETATGQAKWIFDAEIAVPASPAVGTDRVYFASGTALAERTPEQESNAGTVYALSVDPIETERTQLQEELASARSELAELRAAAEAGEDVDRDEVSELRDEIETLERQRQELIRLDSSATEWTADVDGPVNTALAVTSDTVYVSTDSGTVYALDASDGTERWQYNLFEETKSRMVGGPVVAGDRLYVASRETGLVALGASSGTGTDGSDGSDDGETDPSQDNSADSQSSDDGDSGTSEPTESTSGDDGDSESSDGSGPGFGLPTGLAALGGAGYLLNRRSGDLSEDVEKGE